MGTKQVAFTSAVEKACPDLLPTLDRIARDTELGGTRDICDRCGGRLSLGHVLGSLCRPDRNEE